MGQLPYRFLQTTILKSAVSTSSRHDGLRSREDHPGGVEETVTVVPRLSLRGDTLEQEKETPQNSKGMREGTAARQIRVNHWPSLL